MHPAAAPIAGSAGRAWGIDDPVLLEQGDTMISTRHLHADF